MLRALALILAAFSFVGSQAPAQSLENKKPIVFIWSESVDTGKRSPLGSGFVLGESGDVMTAKHVIEQLVGGERLVVSISTKSTFPVIVDMSDLDCDATQDFCFIRIPSDVIAERVTAFYQLGCYVPKADTPLMAAGFFAGGDTHSGVVTPRGNSIGDRISGGLLPTSIALEPGMSGGPVFDEEMHVIAIVKGGSDQFGYVQPLQRARSALSNRGIDCPTTPLRDRAEIEAELDALELVIFDMKRSLGLKSRFIELLDRYIEAPSDERWLAVTLAARGDVVLIQDAIDRAMAFSAKYGTEGSDATIAELNSILGRINARTAPDLQSLDSFSTTHSARVGTLETIARAEASRERAIAYREEMVSYQDQLETDLDKLLGSLRIWMASL